MNRTNLGLHPTPSGGNPGTWVCIGFALGLRWFCDGFAPRRGEGANPTQTQRKPNANPGAQITSLGRGVQTQVGVCYPGLPGITRRVTCVTRPATQRCPHCHNLPGLSKLTRAYPGFPSTEPGATQYYTNSPGTSSSLSGLHSLPAGHRADLT